LPALTSNTPCAPLILDRSSVDKAQCGSALLKSRILEFSPVFSRCSSDKAVQRGSDSLNAAKAILFPERSSFDKAVQCGSATLNACVPSLLIPFALRINVDKVAQCGSASLKAWIPASPMCRPQ